MGTCISNPIGDLEHYAISLLLLLKETLKPGDHSGQFTAIYTLRNMNKFPIIT